MVYYIVQEQKYPRPYSLPPPASESSNRDSEIDEDDDEKYNDDKYGILSPVSPPNN